MCGGRALLRLHRLSCGALLNEVFRDEQAHAVCNLLCCGGHRYDFSSVEVGLGGSPDAGLFPETNHPKTKHPIPTTAAAMPCFMCLSIEPSLWPGRKLGREFAVCVK